MYNNKQQKKNGNVVQNKTAFSLIKMNAIGTIQYTYFKNEVVILTVLKIKN